LPSTNAGVAKIGSARAIHALRESLEGPNREVRVRAAELLKGSGRLDSLDDVIVEGLRFGALGQGLAESERLAAAHPSEAVQDALLHGALCSTDGRAVRFVGILYFVHGKASDPFDQDRREVFLRFNTQDPVERRRLFDQMCQALGIDGSQVTCSPAVAQAPASKRPWWRIWD